MPGRSLGEGLLCAVHLLGRVLQDPCDMFLDHRVSVWKAVRYLQRIPIHLAHNLKTQLIIPLLPLSLPSLLPPRITDPLPLSPPPLSIQLIPDLREHNGLHPVVKQRVALEEIDDVEGDLGVLGKVGDGEVEPLGVALGVDVVLKGEIECGG